MITPHPQPASRTRPPRILVVEDEPVMARMIAELVREFGYEVSSVARTAAMARLQIAMRNFDCVLLDINLEGESHPEISDVLLEAGVPFEPAHDIDESLLLPARDELLQCLGDSGLLRALAADLQRALDQLWVDRQVRGHV